MQQNTIKRNVNTKSEAKTYNILLLFNEKQRKYSTKIVVCFEDKHLLIFNLKDLIKGILLADTF